MNKNIVYTILWRDAAYTFEPELPEVLPEPRLTTGFVIKTTEKYVFIATNVSYNKENGEISPVDGFIIPQNTVIKLKKANDGN